MKLGQYRVLSAVLRLDGEFTTADLVRETGVSPAVVRKTYERYAQFFTEVRSEKSGPLGGQRKVRRLTAREELALELSQTRSHIELPSPPHGPNGEPLGLLAAERVFYDLALTSDNEERRRLVREAQSHLEVAKLEDAPRNQQVKERLDKLERAIDRELRLQRDQRGRATSDLITLVALGEQSTDHLEKAVAAGTFIRNANLTRHQASDVVALLGKAVHALRTAIENMTPDRVHRALAMTRTDLGDALDRFGERGGGSASLEMEVNAYCANLAELTRNSRYHDELFGAHK
jgi:hypothetical protein